MCLALDMDESGKFQEKVSTNCDKILIFLIVKMGYPTNEEARICVGILSIS